MDEDRSHVLRFEPGNGWKWSKYVQINNVLLVKIEVPVWYTIYHHLPVVKGVSPNPSINQPTNGNLGHQGPIDDQITGTAAGLFFCTKVAPTSRRIKYL
jgi:hypothetical protein